MNIKVAAFTVSEKSNYTEREREGERERELSRFRASASIIHYVSMEKVDCRTCLNARKIKAVSVVEQRLLVAVLVCRLLYIL